MFNVKIKLDRYQEDGILKRVTEQYLVNAMSCTEAEARILQYLEKDGLEETNVPTISEANYSVVFADNDGDPFFKAKVSFISIDEQAGKEKRINQFMLIQAENIEKALSQLLHEFKGFTVPYEIHSITETKILDYVNY